MSPLIMYEWQNNKEKTQLRQFDAMCLMFDYDIRQNLVFANTFILRLIVLINNRNIIIVAIKKKRPSKMYMSHKVLPQNERSKIRALKYLAKQKYIEELRSSLKYYEFRTRRTN